jgi:putative flippase GtrA
MWASADAIPMSLWQYARFLIIGAFVGIVTVGCRELIGYLLVADTRRNFSISVAMAYAVGITLSFFLNHRFTFGGDERSRNWRVFVLFVVIAIAGLFSTWILSLTLRYGTHLDAHIGRAAKPVAFATATLLSSLLTYPLNARFVFAGRRSSAATSSCAT